MIAYNKVWERHLNMSPIYPNTDKYTTKPSKPHILQVF